MATLADVRDELADILSRVTGIRADGYVGMGPPWVPCFRVARSEFDPRLAYGSTKVTVPFTVVAFASADADRAGEILLDQMADNSGKLSVRAALETRSNWSLAIDYCVLVRIGEPQMAEIGGTRVLTTEFDIDVCFDA